MKKIFFHGTNTKRKAESILKNGFNKGTWFADHLETALNMGGKHIFLVIFEVKGKRVYNWQVVLQNHISKDRILRYEIHNIKIVKRNKKLEKEFYNFN